MRAEWIEGQGPGFEDALAVRVAVFVQEQGYSPESEPDALDTKSWHVVAYDGPTPVATARLYEDAPGEWHIGRVAVQAAGRGKGLGSLVMRHAIEKARGLGAACILLGAQYDKTHFYETLGFAATGEKFLDEGYPHVMMRLSL